MYYLVQSSNAINTSKLCLPTSPYGHCVLGDIAPCQLCRSDQDSFPQQTLQFRFLNTMVSLTKLLIPRRGFCGAHWGVWAFPVLVHLNLMQTFWRSLHLLVGSALKRKNMLSVLHSLWLLGDPNFTRLFTRDIECLSWSRSLLERKGSQGKNHAVRTRIGRAGFNQTTSSFVRPRSHCGTGRNPRAPLQACGPADSPAQTV